MRLHLTPVAPTNRAGRSGDSPWWQRKAVAIPASLALALAAGGGGYASHHHAQQERYHQAVTACAQALTKAEAADADRADALEEAQALIDATRAMTDTSISDDQVDTLREATTELRTAAWSTLPQCEGDTRTLHQVAGQLATGAAALAPLTQAVTDAAAPLERVLTTTAVQALDAAVQAGQAKVEEATNAVTEAEGHVGDDAVRSAVSQAAEALNQVLTQAASIDRHSLTALTRTTASVTDATSALQTALDALAAARTDWDQAQAGLADGVGAGTADGTGATTGRTGRTGVYTGRPDSTNGTGGGYTGGPAATGSTDPAHSTGGTGAATAPDTSGGAGGGADSSDGVAPRPPATQDGGDDQGGGTGNEDTGQG